MTVGNQRILSVSSGVFFPSDLIQLLFWEDESLQLPAAVISASTNKTSRKKGWDSFYREKKVRAILCILSIFSFRKKVVQKEHLCIVCF